ncbi:MAG: hypothetical protein CMM54_02365 [Rhodospirillaceae bacterium]|nr:hypothetical protein [Rhodospirillaceae bacterium]|tara:strand:- start:4738 stop:6090 length:1353 start_codon:yes stop_codon:yes gene_type:complete
MKFIFADSLDYVDPNYDFLTDRSPPEREIYWDDVFPHELLGYAPYDGILVSRGIVGGMFSGKYSESQAMRFRRVGAREFLRYHEKDYPNSLVFGDCGAFTYHKMTEPPFTAEDTVDFYGDGRFTHGCSVDHIIFAFEVLSTSEEKSKANSNLPGDIENRRRYELTLSNAREFLERSQRLGNQFTPVGVIQGWSPLSMASAANELVSMGYQYLAVGGMAPLKAHQIHIVLDAIRDEIGEKPQLHILGFAKADQITEFLRHKLSSFDTTSPLIRAFKDTRYNYFMPSDGKKLEYFTAIRIPQALENNALMRLVKEGAYSQEDLQNRESTALDLVRAYDRNEAAMEEALDAVIHYNKALIFGRDNGLTDRDKKKIDAVRERTARTLSARPWKYCDCNICQSISIDVVIFRASNRNKRRGIHNLAVYGKHIAQLESHPLNDTESEFQSDQSAAE